VIRAAGSATSGARSLHEASRFVEAARLGEAGDEPQVLDQEPLGVLDADPGRDGEQLLRIGDAGNADDDSWFEAFGAASTDPTGDRRGV